MEKALVESNFKRVEKVLLALDVMARKPMQKDRVNVDASIHRFELCIDVFLRFLRDLLETKGVVVQYPKDVLREAYTGHFIDDEKIWLSMLQDRNLTSHTYDEKLADQIYQRIQQYVPVFQKTYQALRKQS